MISRHNFKAASDSQLTIKLHYFYKKQKRMVLFQQNPQVTHVKKGHMNRREHIFVHHMLTSVIN